MKEVVESPFALGVLGSLAISNWRAEPGRAHVRRAAHLLRTLSRCHDGILLLPVIGKRCPVPAEPVRAELSAALTKAGGAVQGGASVVKGYAFRSAAIRVLISVGVVVRTDCLQRAFRVASEAAEFLAEKSDGRLRDADIVHEARSLRTREEP